MTQQKAIALRATQTSPPYPYAGDAQLELGNYRPSLSNSTTILVDPPDGMLHPGLSSSSPPATEPASTGSPATPHRPPRTSTSAIDLGHQLHLPDENIAWTQFMLGEQFFQARRPRRRRATKRPPPSPPSRDYHRALAAMGQIRAAQARYPESIAFYKDAVAIIPLPLYLAALGDVYTAAGDKANAEKQYAVVEFIGKLNAINQQVYNRELALFYADHNRKLPRGLDPRPERNLKSATTSTPQDALAWALLKNNQPGRRRAGRDRERPSASAPGRHAGLPRRNDLRRPRRQAKAAAHLQRALAISPALPRPLCSQALKPVAFLEVHPRRHLK